jgi:hypothetical protein
MKIEYTVEGRKDVVGKDWVCYTRDSFNLTNVFHELINTIKRDKNLSFEELYDNIGETYYNRTSKSRCDLYKTGGMINICKPNKTLPHVWVVKNEEL